MREIYDAALGAAGGLAGKAMQGVLSLQQEGLRKNPVRLFITAAPFEGRDLLEGSKRPVGELLDAHIAESNLWFAYTSASVNFGNPKFINSDLSRFSVNDFSSFNESSVTKATSFKGSNLDSANFLLLVAKKNDGTTLHGEALKDFFKSQQALQIEKEGVPIASAGLAMYSFTDVSSRLGQINQKSEAIHSEQEQRWLKDQIVIGARYINANRQEEGLAKATAAPHNKEIRNFNKIATELRAKYSFINAQLTDKEKQLLIEVINEQPAISSAASSPAMGATKSKGDALDSLDLGASAQGAPNAGQGKASGSGASAQPAAQPAAQEEQKSSSRATTPSPQADALEDQGNSSRSNSPAPSRLPSPPPAQEVESQGNVRQLPQASVGAHSEKVVASKQLGNKKVKGRS